MCDGLNDNKERLMNDLKAIADYCLECKNPRCVKHCPISTPIPEVIQLFKEGKEMEAGERLYENNPLSQICAIVCPHEKQCVGHCIRGIKGEPVHFPEIEHYLSKMYLDTLKVEKLADKEERVAIVGGGPAGMTLAFKLAVKGYKITIFDAHDRIGGVLRYGIPEYRLPNTIVDQYEEKLRELGVVIRPNLLVGPGITLDQLFADRYEAIFIGTGVWKPKALGVKGESLGHVHYAIDYLKVPEVYTLGEHVCVIGAGNVAMDAARTAKRGGAKKVTILYRKDFDNMPCTRQELREAKEDGVSFELFKAPTKITEDGVYYVETENALDETGRVITTIKNNEEQLFACDSIIIAVSQEARNNIVATAEDLQINKWGLIITDEKGHTTKQGVFASGDVVTGAETVVRAAAHAKCVAEEIDAYIQSKKGENTL